VANKKKTDKPVGGGFEEAQKYLDKMFGKGTIMKMGDSPIDEVETFSTGSIRIDSVLGIGGIPRGRVVELFGPEMGGKCFPSRVRVSTPRGLLTIEEIFAANGMKASCTSRTTESVFPIHNRYGEVEDTTHFTHNYKRPIFTVKTRAGGELPATANNPHLVMSKNGFWVWRRASELKPGDFLCASRKVVKDGNELVHEDSESAYFAGVAIADGGFGKNRLGVTNDDPCIKSAIETSGPQIFGVEPRTYLNNDNDSIQYHFNTKSGVAAFYKHWGWCRCTSPSKVVGARVRRLDHASLVSFIQGYFDCECSVEAFKQCIEVISASRELLSDVKLLLQLRFGIMSSLRSKTVSNYPDNNYWRLSVTGSDARRFISEIGSRSKYRVSQHQELLGQCNDGGSPNLDSIPNIGLLLRDLYDSCDTTRAHHDLIFSYMGDSPKACVTRSRLDKIIDAFSDRGNQIIVDRLREIRSRDYYYDRVEEVVVSAPEPPFDFAMKETASLNVNGFISHNTTLALQIIAKAQEAGLNTAFIDAEHALDTKYARKLGVDVDGLLMSQPDYGEQALTIADVLIRTGAADLIVVDSVAALVPRAELDGEMGDQLPGLQARMMSQALRKLTAVTGKANVTVIFINQLRSKIMQGGMVKGATNTTTGGNALKFYASVRIETRIIGQVKKGSGDNAERIGSKLRVKIVKNKLAPPFQETDVDVVFGYGIDPVSEVLDLAIEHGEVIQSGSWFSCGGERIGQGRANAVAFLRNDVEYYENLRSTVIDVMSVDDDDGSPPVIADPDPDPDPDPDDS